MAKFANPQLYLTNATPDVRFGEGLKITNSVEKSRKSANSFVKKVIKGNQTSIGQKITAGAVIDVFSISSETEINHTMYSSSETEYRNEEETFWAQKFEVEITLKKDQAFICAAEMKMYVFKAHDGSIVRLTLPTGRTHVGAFEKDRIDGFILDDTFEGTVKLMDWDKAVKIYSETEIEKNIASSNVLHQMPEPAKPCPATWHTWQRITGGNVYGITNDSQYIYGIGTDNNVYAHEISGSGSWVKIAGGNVKHIELKNGTIYGVGTDNCVYTHQLRSGSWSKLTGGDVYKIKLTPSFIYGLGTDNCIYKHPYSSGSWSKVTHSGSVKQFDIHGDTIYGVGMANTIYSHALDGSGSWLHSITDGEVWFVCTANDCIYGIGMDNCVYKHLYNGGSWQKMTTGEVKDIRLEKRVIYGVGIQNEVYKNNAEVSGHVCQ